MVLDFYRPQRNSPAAIFLPHRQAIGYYLLLYDVLHPLWASGPGKRAFLQKLRQKHSAFGGIRIYGHIR